jgi:hypothetical protein
MINLSFIIFSIFMIFFILLIVNLLTNSMLYKKNNKSMMYFLCSIGLLLLFWLVKKSSNLEGWLIVIPVIMILIKESVQDYLIKEIYPKIILGKDYTTIRSIFLPKIWLILLGTYWMIIGLIFMNHSILAIGIFPIISTFLFPIEATYRGNLNPEKWKEFAASPLIGSFIKMDYVLKIQYKDKESALKILENESFLKLVKIRLYLDLKKEDEYLEEISRIEVPKEFLFDTLELYFRRNLTFKGLKLFKHRSGELNKEESSIILGITKYFKGEFDDALSLLKGYPYWTELVEKRELPPIYYSFLNRNKFIKLDYKRDSSKDRSFMKKYKELYLKEIKGECPSCECKTKSFDMDHFYLPKSKGGSFLMKTLDGNNLLNAVLLCETCNRSKGAKSPFDFFKKEVLYKLIELNQRVTLLIKEKDF